MWRTSEGMRSSEGALSAPSCSQSLVNALKGQSEFSAPVLQALMAASVFDQHGPSLIDALFLGGGPAAILRCITEGVVEAVNRVLRRGAWPHVSVEGFKRIKPTLADGHASPAVAIKIGATGIRASFNQSSPRTVFLRLGHAMRGLGFQHLDLDAAARMRAVQIGAGDHRLLAAVAAAAVARMSRVGGITDEGDHGQAPVAVSWRQQGEDHRPILPYFTYSRAQQPPLGAQTWH